MVESPCNSTCLINQKNNLCKGCKRSVIEITNWISYSDKEKRKIIKNIKNKN